MIRLGGDALTIPGVLRLSRVSSAWSTEVRSNALNALMRRLYRSFPIQETEAVLIAALFVSFRAPRSYGCGSRPMVYHFGVAAPSICVGIGIFTGGTGF